MRLTTSRCRSQTANSTRYWSAVVCFSRCRPFLKPSFLFATVPRVTALLRSLKLPMIANSHNIDPSACSQAAPAWADAWHLWTSLSRDDRSRVGSFGGRYGGVAAGGVGSTRNSSSIWTTSVTPTNHQRLIRAFFTGERVPLNYRTSMRYFFHIFDGPTVFPDEVGNTLSSPEIAISKPKSSLPNYAKPASSAARIWCWCCTRVPRMSFDVELNNKGCALLIQ